MVRRYECGLFYECFSILSGEIDIAMTKKPRTIYNNLTVI